MVFFFEGVICIILFFGGVLVGGNFLFWVWFDIFFFFVGSFNICMKRF